MVHDPARPPAVSVDPQAVGRPSEGRGEADLAAAWARYRQALTRRERWLPLWQDCYAVALPAHASFTGTALPGARAGEALYDATAPDAVDQLAASLLAHLMPPWSRWFGLVPGPDLDPGMATALAPALDQAADVLHGHLDRSNFAVEMHQCFLDLVVGGTASLLVEAAPSGSAAAFTFAAVPLSQVALAAGAGGGRDSTYRQLGLTRHALADRFGPMALSALPAPQPGHRDPEGADAVVVEMVEPDPGGPGYRYRAVLAGTAEPLGVRPSPAAAPGHPGAVLAEGRFDRSPFINFRWLKATGEAYGRSPVMKALPDIKTANKVVELVLKNATLAITGVWQADDDGVLDPATIELLPGAIIPKAVGSSGLTPLAPPGRFDISQLVLEDLRARIRHALLVDQLAELNAPRMTATEVLERSAAMTRLLGATYGRLQAELLTPLLRRCFDLLRKRGEVPDLPLDGQTVVIRHRSPLAQAQAQRAVGGALSWLEMAQALGPEALATIDGPAMMRWLADRFGVPADLIRSPADARADPPSDRR